MKRFIGIATLSVIMLVVSQSVNAQTLKFGHINSDELLQSLPDFDTARVKLEKIYKGTAESV